MADDALSMWREKLAHLESELAITSDASKQFTIQQEIKKAKTKIAELEGEQCKRTSRSAGR